MAWTTSARVERLRRANALADLVVETLDGFRRHLSGRNAAVLSYYGFLTLFPLLMAATTILGFLLEDNPELQQQIVDSAISQIPVIGPEIQASAGTITGSWPALVIGVLIALWSSLKAFVAIQGALDDCWEVDLDDRANAAVKRLKSLIGILVIGIAQVGSVVLAALTAEAGLPRNGQILLALGGLALNVASVAAIYHFLTSYEVSWRDVMPGAILTGVLYTVLQYFGTRLMTRIVTNAQNVYGAFAGTLGLLTWLSLHALISLYGAELNAAIGRIGRRTAAAEGDGCSGQV